MSYLNFDKKLLSNLERSLSKEMIRTNRAGAYNSTTLIDCNTRKYHGQLVLPLGAPLPEGNYVLLGSLDETVIQHGAEFNLGIHQYDEERQNQYRGFACNNETTGCSPRYKFHCPGRCSSRFVCEQVVG